MVVVYGKGSRGWIGMAINTKSTPQTPGLATSFGGAECGWVVTPSLKAAFQLTNSPITPYNYSPNPNIEIEKPYIHHFSAYVLLKPPCLSLFLAS